MEKAIFLSVLLFGLIGCQSVTVHNSSDAMTKTSNENIDKPEVFEVDPQFREPTLIGKISIENNGLILTDVEDIVAVPVMIIPEKGVNISIDNDGIWFGSKKVKFDEYQLFYATLASKDNSSECTPIPNKCVVIIHSFVDISREAIDSWVETEKFFLKKHREIGVL